MDGLIFQDRVLMAENVAKKLVVSWFQLVEESFDRFQGKLSSSNWFDKGWWLKKEVKEVEILLHVFTVNGCLAIILHFVRWERLIDGLN